MSCSVDLIVPTITGREESLERCLESFPGTNPIVIRDLETCGEAWIAGLKHSEADYVMLCCDDIEGTGNPDQLDAAMHVAGKGRLPSPIVHRADGSLESAGGDMGLAGCLIREIRPDGSPVGFTPMPFGTREQARLIGMIPAHYMTDVYWSSKGRELGFQTVLCHGWQLTHHHHMTGRKHPSAEDDRLYRQALDRYASHLPVLRDTVHHVRPRRVLEFGGGHHSTPFFLSCDDVEELVTVETSPKWRGELEKYACDRLRVVEDVEDVAGFDLVFIDDGTSAQERAETIRNVLCGAHRTVVIHDVDVPEYMALIENHEHKVWSTSPPTAVIEGNVK